MMARVRVTGCPMLRVTTGADERVLLGRYHPTPPAAAPAMVARRLTGGRVMPDGAGFAAIALVLPHRSALEGPEAPALRAEQVMNRLVRGVLEACTRLDVEAYYPGRDLVTVAGRPVGWLSLTADDDGVTLFEAGLAVHADLSVLPRLLDRLDPDGVVPATLWLPDAVTSLSREVGGDSLTDTRALDALADGFGARLGLDLVPGPDLPAAEGDGSYGVEPWVVDAALDRCNEVASMLGTLRVHLALDDHGHIARLRLVGDVIAPPATMRAVEEALVGAALDEAEVTARLAAALAGDEHWLLGTGPMATLARSIARGTA
jgi:lipoate-protein ligase A